MTASLHNHELVAMRIMPSHNHWAILYYRIRPPREGGPILRQNKTRRNAQLRSFGGKVVHFLVEFVSLRFTTAPGGRPPGAPRTLVEMGPQRSQQRVVLGLWDAHTLLKWGIDMPSFRAESNVYVDFAWVQRVLVDPPCVWGFNRGSLGWWC